MALINCPECGREISDKAEKCVQCGCPIEVNTVRRTPPPAETTGVNTKKPGAKFAVAAAAVLLVAVLGAAGFMTGVFGGGKDSVVDSSGGKDSVVDSSGGKDSVVDSSGGKDSGEDSEDSGLTIDDLAVVFEDGREIRLGMSREEVERIVDSKIMEESEVETGEIGVVYKNIHNDIYQILLIVFYKDSILTDIYLPRRCQMANGLKKGDSFEIFKELFGEDDIYLQEGGGYSYLLKADGKKLKKLHLSLENTFGKITDESREEALTKAYEDADYLVSAWISKDDGNTIEQVLISKLSN